ncbi:ferritin, heavy subunit [Orussus abietinus]|uniref:ferritin, heavy subunit n=1 Tax=Orussus abietinus TaxID=222816 RepID=UPI0006256E89|nr:ferritin, heavy subunit [Orussus abietinus]
MGLESHLKSFLKTILHQTFGKSRIQNSQLHRRNFCTHLIFMKAVPEHYCPTKFQSVFKLQYRFFSSGCKDKGSKSCPEITKSNAGNQPAWPSGHRISFQFHPETEAILNEQLNVELKAFYYYLSMAAYFGRVDVALPGCESYFIQMHNEEHEHALRFLNFIKMRGGLVNLCPICSPQDQDWKSPLNAFKAALQLEIDVASRLVAVNEVAERHNDLNTSDFIVTGFMEDQMKSVNEMAKLVTVLSGIGDHGLARFIFDRDMLEHYVNSEFNVFENGTREAPTKK